MPPARLRRCEGAQRAQPRSHPSRQPSGEPSRRRPLRPLPASAPDPQHPRLGVLALRALEDRPRLPPLPAPAGHELPRFPADGRRVMAEGPGDSRVMSTGNPKAAGLAIPLASAALCADGVRLRRRRTRPPAASADLRRDRRPAGEAQRPGRDPISTPATPAHAAHAADDLRAAVEGAHLPASMRPGGGRRGRPARRRGQLPAAAAAAGAQEEEARRRTSTVATTTATSTADPRPVIAKHGGTGAARVRRS